MSSHFNFWLLNLFESGPSLFLSLLALLARQLSSVSLSLPFSRSSSESLRRNIAGCRLDERGHTGPAEPVVLSHHKVSTHSLSLSCSLARPHVRTSPSPQPSPPHPSRPAPRLADVKGLLRSSVEAGRSLSGLAAATAGWHSVWPPSRWAAGPA